MERRGLTRRDVAKLLKVNEATVGRWKRGTVPHGRTLDDLVELLGVTKGELFAEAEPSRKGSPEQDFRRLYPRMDELEARGLVEAVIAYCGRDGLNVRSWTDYRRIADATLDAAPSEAFEAKKRARG